jgi:hypothetical protein
MNSLYLYRSATVAAITIFLTFSSGCVVAPDGGYYNGYSAYNAYPGYYEPYGAYYGGWGPDYYVAPYGVAHSVSHATPSIPSHSRSGISVRR